MRLAGRINPTATSKLEAAGYPQLAVYKDIYGWKVWDTRLSHRQYWKGCKRLPAECVKEILKLRNMPYEP